MRLQSHPLGYEIKGDKKNYIVTHGGLANRESMLPIAYALSDNGHNVIIADLPRHGGSNDDKRKGISRWKKLIQQKNITHGIGHSLGAVWICPSREYVKGIKYVTSVGNNCIGSSKISGASFLFKIPIVNKSYHIDHLLEPWNPDVLFRIKDVKNNWKIYIFADALAYFCIWNALLHFTLS